MGVFYLCKLRRVKDRDLLQLSLQALVNSNSDVSSNESLLALIFKRLTILSDDDEYHRHVLRRMNSIIAISDLSLKKTHSSG